MRESLILLKVVAKFDDNIADSIIEADVRDALQ